MTHEEYESKSQMKRVEILKAGGKQMTYEELLAEIDIQTDNDAGYLLGPALHAVVKFHEPIAVLTGMGTGTIYYNQSKLQCKACHGEYNKPGATYPCETYLIIEEELS